MSRFGGRGVPQLYKQIYLVQVYHKRKTLNREALG
uniref:Uncharacterized protein n=1 Tax=Siphoviridae sp. ctiMX17 TaxID=2826432 RepID=A0A8S5N1T3_9CAUD|nr:MAG TPA: hypothetical protein [Siphoviridae sp. ctiMX17]